MDKKIKLSIKTSYIYLETFEATEVRHGAYLLWIDLGETNRHIPLEKVRWFSVNPSSRE